MQSNNKEEHNLYVWGKNYSNKVALLKSKVICAGAGENHILFTTSNWENYGIGSNKFGQLGLKDNVTFSHSTSVFEKYKIMSYHCGAEHTFFITDKYEVYSTGLNIKGQLGHSMLENVSTPKLVTSMLPFGSKNPRSLNPANQKQSKPPIIEILEKFDLQVKIDQISDNIFLLNQDEFVEDIACGALFTIALTNKGRVFGCGFQGVNTISTHDQQLEKTKFKLIQFEKDTKIIRIHAGLSGAAAISKEGSAFVWGRFGKLNFNLPKRMMKAAGYSISKTIEEQKYYDARVGDQFIVFLNTKGQISVMGENFDNQLGFESHELPYQETPLKVKDSPFAQEIYVGRNHVFALDAENNELYGWGSNKYGQIFPVESCNIIMNVCNSKTIFQTGEKIIPSSYFTLLLSKRENISFNNLQKQKRLNENKGKEEQQMIKLSEYKRLLSDYQIIKAMNLTLLEKYQPGKKESKEVQTSSKFDISGVTQFRKFNSNVEITWKELQIETQINEGGYGIIYRAKWREILVVVKKFKIQNGDVSLRDFLSQCHAMEAVRHPHIVMFLGAVTVNPHYSIILEYCSRGSLWSYLQNKQNNISWEQKRRFAIQIAQGVHYLHSCSPPILHRDLKSLNIFLDVNLRIKIGDFGWTKTLDQYMTNKIGTYQWMAPEVIGNKPYTEKADIFSYSIILWEIASRQPPYKNITGAKVSEEVLKSQLRPTIPNKVPEGFSKLMKRCWESQPSKRPSFKEIIRQFEVMKLDK